MFGYVEVVRLLLEYGADPSACNNLGESPSHVTSQNGHQQTVRLLSEYAAKPVKEYYVVSACRLYEMLASGIVVTALPCM